LLSASDIRATIPTVPALPETAIVGARRLLLPIPMSPVVAPDRAVLHLLETEMPFASVHEAPERTDTEEVIGIEVESGRDHHRVGRTLLGVKMTGIGLGLHCEVRIRDMSRHLDEM
jgi:hypothetical protein